MKTFASGKITMNALLCVLAATVGLAAGPAARVAVGQVTAKSLTKPEILQKARDNSYVLQTQGLKTFQVNVEPNWKQFIEDIKKTIQPSEAWITAVSLVQCTVVVNNQGETTVTPYSTDGKEIEHVADESVGGVKQMVQGFFQIWNSIVFTSVFPDPNDMTFAMQEQPDGYLFTGSGATEGQEFKIDKDYQLTSLKVVSSSTIILMNPKYKRIEKGFLLTGIEADINNGTQQLTIQVQYASVEGFQLPTRAWYRVVVPNRTPILIDMEFNKYQVNKP